LGAGQGKPSDTIILIGENPVHIERFEFDTGVTFAIPGGSKDCFVVAVIHHFDSFGFGKGACFVRLFMFA
jgi:hypothetical protein